MRYRTAIMYKIYPIEFKTANVAAVFAEFFNLAEKREVQYKLKKQRLWKIYSKS